MDVKYQVFISSTFTDLVAERHAVMDQILNMGHIPVGMELFQAANDTQWNYIKRRIESSDYFISIIAERYGSVDDTGKSFTQKEYEYALECKVPVAAFVISDEARRKLPIGQVDVDRKSEIEGFRALVGKKLFKYWSDANDLKSKVGPTLDGLIEDCPRTGWIRGDSIMIKTLNGNAGDSRQASSLLLSAIERDLSATGYYRTGQVINFKIDATKEVVRVHLHFQSKIVPVRSPTLVLRPKVKRAPEGAKLVEPTTYSIGDADVDDDYHEVNEMTDDNFLVTYELADRNASVTDLHYWPSPVLDYRVRLESAGPFELNVGKIIGGGGATSLSKNASNQLEFISNSAAFTAQGIKWTLSPAKAS